MLPISQSCFPTETKGFWTPFKCHRTLNVLREERPEQVVARGASIYLFWSLIYRSVAFWALEMFLPICYQKLIYFQVFWWESMTTYGYKMCYDLSFAKERFAAVLETTKNKKIRREWRVFPLLTINLLKPFSLHPSTRWRRYCIHCKMERCSTVQLHVQSKLILNLWQMLPVTMQCFQFNDSLKNANIAPMCPLILQRDCIFLFLLSKLCTYWSNSSE